MRRSLATILLLAPFAAASADGTAGSPPAVRAARAPGGIRLDGRLDEPAWGLAEPFDTFVQLFPEEGGAPSERTVVRVLYDDERLYIGVECLDSDPAAVMALLGRRDTIPYSDEVRVYLDPARDRRNAYVFALNAAGVQEDGLAYDDDRYTNVWDAVWDGRAAVGPHGWSAELAIPLGSLSRRAGAAGAWGFGVKREIARLHETVASALVPRDAGVLVSRLGLLEGLEGLAERRDLEVAPYLAARIARRPRSPDPARPEPRATDVVLDLGADARWAVTRGLSLNVALNPDFGQVEADQVVQNLTTFEVQYPEKRPFFLEGLDLFQAVGTGRETIPQQMFYSRRIGADAPILAAAKVSGRASGSLQLGLLDAVVAGAGREPGASEDVPDRRYRFHPEQPLHLAPEDSLPLVAPAARNFFAGVARWKAADPLKLGLWVTSAVPMTLPCTEADPALPPGERPGRCDARGGNAAAVDASLRSGDGEWFLYGQAAASQIVGGPPARRLPDGVVLRPGDRGAGAYLTAGRIGGEPWRVEVHYDYQSPRLDLNASGFQKTQNDQTGRLALRYVRPLGGGPFLSYSASLSGSVQWTTDGRGIVRGASVGLDLAAQLRSFQQISCTLAHDDFRFDVREIRGSGIPYLRIPLRLARCALSTDLRRPLYLELSGWVGHYPSRGPLEGSDVYGGRTVAVYRPHPSFEARLELEAERGDYRARWIETQPAAIPTDPDTLLFADQRSAYLSALLRLQLVLTPRLTLQGYGQLYTEYWRFGPYYTARVPAEGAVLPAQLVPGGTPSALPDLHRTLLNVNLVLRWEYRLGSVLYAVYTRSQAELPWSDAATPPPAGLAPRALGPGPTADTFLVKWSYWWSL